MAHTSMVGASPPAFPLLAREIAAFAYTRLRASFAPVVSELPQGDGRTVVVFPGFMASDATTSRLRRSLHMAGFDAHGWNMGRNYGVKTDTLDHIAERLAPLTANGPMTLVGWSLGGLIAREYAKRFPEQTAKVISLGTPFSGGPYANNAWRVYEMVARHKVDNLPIDTVLSEKPDVPTIAIWSSNDGVVAPHSAYGAPGEADASIELDCSHMAFVADPIAIRTICQAILA
ncbi:MAG: esterase/lipase family protein [Sphingorhabdus sp.]